MYVNLLYLWSQVTAMVILWFEKGLKNHCFNKTEIPIIYYPRRLGFNTNIIKKIK